VKLRDDTIEPACCVSSVSLEELFVELGYRPGAQAVRYEALRLAILFIRHEIQDYCYYNEQNEHYFLTLITAG
jgi:hypothetical protein